MSIAKGNEHLQRDKISENENRSIEKGNNAQLELEEKILTYRRKTGHEYENIAGGKLK